MLRYYCKREDLAALSPRPTGRGGGPNSVGGVSELQMSAALVRGLSVSSVRVETNRHAAVPLARVDGRLSRLQGDVLRQRRLSVKGRRGGGATGYG